MKYFDQKLVTSHICYCGSQYLSLTHIHSLSIIVELLWNQLMSRTLDKCNTFF